MNYGSVKIVFNDVCGFRFSHCSEYVFGNIERVKFFWLQWMEFLSSIDPDPVNLDSPSVMDNDCISAKNIRIETAG